MTAEIDLRHRQWLKSVLMSGKFKRVLEIGSFKGWSTTAFLEARDHGAVSEVHLCEPHPRLELQWLIAKRDRVTLHQTTSVELLQRDGSWDFLFLDGDHGLENCLRELEVLKTLDVPLLCFHDTGSAGRYPGCEGPGHFKQHYLREGFLVIEDTLYRPGEKTERGLCFATRDPELYEVVREGYLYHC